MNKTLDTIIKVTASIALAASIPMVVVGLGATPVGIVGACFLGAATPALYWKLLS